MWRKSPELLNPIFCHFLELLSNDLNLINHFLWIPPVEPYHAVVNQPPTLSFTNWYNDMIISILWSKLFHCPISLLNLCLSKFSTLSNTNSRWCILYQLYNLFWRLMFLSGIRKKLITWHIIRSNKKTGFEW